MVQLNISVVLHNVNCWSSAASEESLTTRIVQLFRPFILMPSIRRHTLWNCWNVASVSSWFCFRRHKHYYDILEKKEKEEKENCLSTLLVNESLWLGEDSVMSSQLIRADIMLACRNGLNVLLIATWQKCGSWPIIARMCSSWVSPFSTSDQWQISYIDHLRPDSGHCLCPLWTLLKSHKLSFLIRLFHFCITEEEPGSSWPPGWKRLL